MNGNIIKLLHVNKSSSNILSKISLIQDLFDREQPLVASINESNCVLTEPKQINPIEGYKLEHKLLDINNHVATKARTSMAIKSGTNYERMSSLETDINPIIWIKIKLKQTEPLLICSGYRQWSILEEHKVKNSNGLRQQKLRFASYLKCLKAAVETKLKLIIFHDVNIDTSINNNHNSKYNIKQLYEDYLNFLIENNLTILNKKFTRYSSHQSPSLIDHVVTNSPALVSEVLTTRNLISDHCTLTCNFLTKERVNFIRFRIIRDFKNLTQDSLKFKLQKNIKIQNILRETDPNVIAETLNDELNRIIDELAPKKRVIVNKKNQPWLNNDLRDKMRRVDDLLTVAIDSRMKDDWRLHNHQRNILYKELDAAKRAYLGKRLDDPKKGWKEIKQFNGLNKATTPSRISHEGSIVTSPKLIADIANKFYINKVVKLSQAMCHERRDPVAL